MDQNLSLTYHKNLHNSNFLSFLSQGISLGFDTTKRALKGIKQVKIKVNPVRNFSGALNPSGTFIKPNPTSEQQGIISNGVNSTSTNSSQVLVQSLGLCYVSHHVIRSGVIRS
jgi:hypothetical protein